MEEVTGTPFATLMTQLVLAPAGMLNSTFIQPLPDTLVTRAARGHAFDGTSTPGGWHDYPEAAAAGLWSTPTDLARFAIELSRAFRGESTRLLEPEIARSMLTRQVANMGLGVGVHGSDEGLHFDHSGWTRGTRTYLIAYPEAGQGVVVMANADGGHELIAEVVRAVARAYGWPHFAPDVREITVVPPKTLASLAGRYSVDSSIFELAASAEGDHLVRTTPRGSRYTFYPSEANVFFALEDGSEMTSVRDDQGGHVLQFWGLTAARVP